MNSIIEIIEENLILNKYYLENNKNIQTELTLTSRTARAEEINEEKRKLLVMVKIFGRKTPLELNFMQVEKES